MELESNVGGEEKETASERKESRIYVTGNMKTNVKTAKWVEENVNLKIWKHAIS